MENLIKDFEYLAQLAYRKEELSDFAPLTTKYMFLRLSMLYDCYARGVYTKQQCISLKNELRKEYMNIVKEHDRDMECYREYIKNRNENQMLLIKLEKSKDKKEMLETSLKIIGNCVNDQGLYQRNVNKLTTLIFDM